MVKTVLHELVKLRGAAIKGHLSLVPIDMKLQPIILAYIDLNLELVVNLIMTIPTFLSLYMEASYFRNHYPLYLI